MEHVGCNGRPSLPGGAAANPDAEPRRGVLLVRSPMLIGRGRELALLLEAAANPPGLAIVEGEAGIGKTRLVEDLLGSRRLRGRRVLVGHSHRMREPFPLGPVVEALRGVGAEPLAATPSPVVGVLAGLLPELSEHLPPEPKPLGEPRAEQHRTFRAILELLEALGPAVLVLEDLHWADTATVDLLGFLVRRPPPDLSVVLTYRREGTEVNLALSELISRTASDTLSRVVCLGALTSGEVRRLIGAMLGTDEVSEAFATRIHEWTSGIPFAVEEVIRLLRDRDPLLAVTGCPGGAPDKPAVPPGIRDAFVARLAPLGSDARLTVWAAAVLGAPADENLVISVAGLPSGRGASGLTEALSVGALEERGKAMYGFRHELGAQAVYESILGPRRRRLHLQAGRALDARVQPRPLAQIAYHLKEGGSAKWPRYAEAAAMAASSAGDDRLAASLLEGVLSSARLSRAAKIRMSIALGDAAAYGASEQAIRILRQIVDEGVLPAGVRGELRLSLSRLLAHAGDIAGWHREAKRAVAELRCRPELRVRAMMSLAQPLFPSEAEQDNHLEWLGRAMKEAERCDDPVARVAFTAQRAAILLRLGDSAGWAAAEEIPRAGDTVKEKLQLLRGYHALALTALGLGHHSRAESWLAEADGIHNELGNHWWDLWLGSTHACFDWVGGRWEGLDARLRELLRKTVTIPVLTIGNELTLGSLLLARGELDEARRTLTSALETARDAQLVWESVGVAGRLAHVHLELGDPERAHRAAKLGLDAVRRTGSWLPGRNVAREATQALIARGNPASARALVDEFAMGLRGRDAPACMAVLASCRGAVADALGHREAAMLHFTRAADGWAKLPHRLEAARARERRALGAPAGYSEEQGALLLGALETFEILGADGDARRVRAQLTALRAWRGGRKGYGEKLSPREAQVARLAADGKTNREIAGTLVISPRTVEAHVAASLRKLSLASRDEIASVAGLEQKIGSPTYS